MTKELSLIEFSEDQINLIKSQIAPKATNDELQLFLYQARRTGLDPLTRQIYCVHRNVKVKEKGVEKWVPKMTILTSIDGFRVIAERSGNYAGQDEPVWIDDEKGIPTKCTVKVYKFAPDGQRYCASVGVAYFKEYYPNPELLQKSMPHNMIAKVAEALALRKAFPQDLSGLYTNDEMTQSEDPIKTVNPSENQTDTERTPLQKIAMGANEDMVDIVYDYLIAELDKCQTIADLEAFKNKDKKSFSKLKKISEESYERLVAKCISKKDQFFAEERSNFSDEEYVINAG